MVTTVASPQPPPLLDADVHVVVQCARHLPRGLLAPRAKVQLFSPFHEQPLAESDAFARSTAPEWNFSARLQLPHISGVFPVVNVVILDAGAPDTPLGKTSLTLSTTTTRAWLPLEAMSTRADVLLIATWPRCPQYVPPSLPIPPPPSATIGAELRTVDPRPGALFRDGTLVADVVAIGIPASVALPFVTVRTGDQILRASETPASRSWWKRRCENQTSAANDADALPPADSSVDSLTASQSNDGEALSPAPDSQAANDASSTSFDADIEPARSVETIASSSRSYKSDSAGFSSSPSSSSSSISNPPTRSNCLRRRAAARGNSALSSFNKDSIRQGTKSARNALRSEGVRGSTRNAVTALKTEVKDASNPLAKSTLDTLVHLKPTRSGVGAAVTSAKIRRRSAVPPQSTREAKPATAPPVAVLQTLLAPRVRRAVDFGRFAFAEVSGLHSTRLTISVTDSDSLLPDAVGTVFEAELPLALVGAPGSYTTLTACEVGPAHAKAAVWVRLTRIRDAKGAAAHCTVVTSRFQNILREMPELAPGFKQKYPHAERLTYLLVGGLFTNYYPLYFSRNIDYLQQTLQLARVQIVPINTESGLAANARVIAASVAKTATRRNSVVLIGHSKGGVDILEALANHIEIIPFIYGVISYQAPFLGTYAIDYLTNHNLADAIGSAMEALWHGQRESLLDVSYAARAKSLEMFNSPTGVEGTRAMVLRDVPIISVASCASFELHTIRSAANAAGIASMSAIAAIITKNTGFRCDGLVVPADAMIPFCDLVYVDDMMHTEPALYVPGTEYPPGEMTAALLTLLFEKAERECIDESSADAKSSSKST